MLRKIIFCGLFVLGINELHAQPAPTDLTPTDLNAVIAAYQPAPAQPQNPFAFALNTARTSYPTLSEEQPPLSRESAPTQQQRFAFFYLLVTNPEQFCTACQILPPEDKLQLISFLYPENRVMNWQEVLTFFERFFPDYLQKTTFIILQTLLSKNDTEDNQRFVLINQLIQNIMNNFVIPDIDLIKAFIGLLDTVNADSAESLGFQNLELWRRFILFLVKNIDQSDDTIVERSLLLISLGKLMEPAFFEKGKMPDDQLWLDIYTVNPHAFDRTLKIYLSDGSELFLFKKLMAIRSCLNQGKTEQAETHTRELTLFANAKEEKYRALINRIRHEFLSRSLKIPQSLASRQPPTPKPAKQKEKGTSQHPQSDSRNYVLASELAMALQHDLEQQTRLSDFSRNAVRKERNALIQAQAAQLFRKEKKKD